MNIQHPNSPSRCHGSSSAESTTSRISSKSSPPSLKLLSLAIPSTASPGSSQSSFCSSSLPFASSVLIESCSFPRSRSLPASATPSRAISECLRFLCASGVATVGERGGSGGVAMLDVCVISYVFHVRCALARKKFVLLLTECFSGRCFQNFPKRKARAGKKSWKVPAQINWKVWSVANE